MSKIVLKSGRTDVRALDEMFEALGGCGHEASVRVLRFYCASQGIKAVHLFPEIYAPENR